MAEKGNGQPSDEVDARRTGRAGERLATMLVTRKPKTSR
jgi:hypothetical protein